MIKLGQTGRDVISGYTGIVMARTEYLTGCNQILLVPTELDEKGERREGEFFDDIRIEISNSAIMPLAQPHAAASANPGCDESSAPKR